MLQEKRKYNFEILDRFNRYLKQPYMQIVCFNSFIPAEFELRVHDL